MRQAHKHGAESNDDLAGCETSAGRVLAEMQAVQAHRFEFGFRHALLAGRAPIYRDWRTGGFVLAFKVPGISDRIWHGDCAVDAALSLAALRQKLPEASFSVHKVKLPLAAGMGDMRHTHVYVQSDEFLTRVDHSRFYTSLEQEPEETAVRDVLDLCEIDSCQDLRRVRHFEEFAARNQVCLLSFSVEPEIEPPAGSPGGRFITSIMFNLIAQEKGEVDYAYTCIAGAYAGADSKVHVHLENRVFHSGQQSAFVIPFSEFEFRDQISRAALIIGHGLARGLDPLYTGNYRRQIENRRGFRAGIDRKPALSPGVSARDERERRRAVYPRRVFRVINTRNARR